MQAGLILGSSYASSPIPMSLLSLYTCNFFFLYGTCGKQVTKYNNAFKQEHTLMELCGSLTKPADSIPVFKHMLRTKLFKEVWDC